MINSPLHEIKMINQVPKKSKPNYYIWLSWSFDSMKAMPSIKACFMHFFFPSLPYPFTMCVFSFRFFKLSLTCFLCKLLIFTSLFFLSAYLYWMPHYVLKSGSTFKFSWILLFLVLSHLLSLSGSVVNKWHYLL